MGEIRAFAEEHVPEVSALFLRELRGRSDPPPPPLQEYFREIFFANPWISPDIPSWVYWDRGKLCGFLGVLPRTMEFQGRRIRVAVTSQFAVDRKWHRGMAAVELMRRYLAGPQDLSFCDGVTGAVDKIWVACGATRSYLYSFNWLRALRPLGTARIFGSRATGALGGASKMASALATPIDTALSRIPHAAFRPPRSESVSTPLSVADLFSAMHETGWREPLCPRYDLASFEWLMHQVAANRPAGELSMASVSTAAGDLCGYYILQTRRGHQATLLQMGLRRHDYFDRVFTAVLRDAWERKAVAVKGQAMPASLVNLTHHYCLFRQAQTNVLFHSREAAIGNAILRGDAAISRLDGEFWARFATEPWA